MNEITAPAQDEQPADLASPRDAQMGEVFIPTGFSGRPGPWARLMGIAWKLVNIPMGSVVRTVAFALFLLLAIGIVRETLRNVAVIQPIAVPPSVVAQGFTPEVTAQRLLYQIQLISTRNTIVGINNRPYLKKPLAFSSETEQMDIRLPGFDLSLRSTLTYLREMLGFGETKISGEIIQQGTGLFLLLRVQTRKMQSFNISISSLDAESAGGSSGLDAILRQGAREVVKSLDPYSLALYYLDAEAPKAPEVIEYCAVQDASCKPWAAFLRGLAYAGDAGSRSKAIEDFQAATQQLGSAVNGWPARGFAYEYLARLQTGMGTTDSAAAAAAGRNYRTALALFTHHGQSDGLDAGFSGDAYDAFYIGRFLELGLPGSQSGRPDCRGAETWYARAAGKGEAHAENSLADLYSWLEDKPCANRPGRDYQKAIDLYRQAGQQGITYAQRHLGEMYESGLGPDGPSPEVAVYWFKEAARRGDVLARIRLGEIYRDGTGGRPGDPLTAYAWFELACQAQGAPSLLAQAARDRDELATSLGPKDVLEAAKRAQEWNLGMRGDL